MRAGADARINHARRLGTEVEKVADLCALGGRKRVVAELEPAGKAHKLLRFICFCQV